jgi:hypothetical protein
MGVTTDTAITATTIGITTTTIIIVIGHGLPLSTVAPATTATIETSPLFEVALRTEYFAGSVSGTLRARIITPVSGGTVTVLAIRPEQQP